MTDSGIQEKSLGIESYKRINNNSLKNRFGKDLIEKGIKASNDILPFLKVQNQIVVNSKTPDRGSHNSSWTFSPLKEAKALASVSLEDRFPVPISKSDKEAINKKLVGELRQVPNGVEKAKDLPPMLANLSNRVEELDGWKLNTNYYYDSLDDWHYYAISLTKDMGDTKAVVKLDISTGCYLEVKIPLVLNFEDAVKEVGSATKLISNWLELSYSPNLEYEFSMEEGASDYEPSRTASTFPEYFFKVVDYWKEFPTSQNLRALVGKSNDSTKPILILEDPSLSVFSQGRRVSLSDFIYGRNTSSPRLIVSTHPDIFESFSRGIDDERVNQKLVDLFPSGNYYDRDWLHMFVQIDSAGKATLIEDRSSNKGKEELKRNFPNIEKQYGISYGGTIDKNKAEREARRPMFMPTINAKTAIIKEKFGSSAARKFRGYAIAGLIDGREHALERYETYLKLIQ